MPKIKIDDGTEIPIQPVASDLIKTDTIDKFVSILIENTQDFDSRFSKLVDEHFGDLI